MPTHNFFPIHICGYVRVKEKASLHILGCVCAMEKLASQILALIVAIYISNTDKDRKIIYIFFGIFFHPNFRKILIKAVFSKIKIHVRKVKKNNLVNFYYLCSPMMIEI